MLFEYEAFRTEFGHLFSGSEGIDLWVELQNARNPAVTLRTVLAEHGLTPSQIEHCLRDYCKPTHPRT